jgi:hypothetical protein
MFGIFRIGFVALTVSVIGCGTQAPKVAQKEPHSSTEHTHKPAAHGGTIVEIGRDNYHAEVVFEKGGTLRLYMLGQDEAKVQEVEAKTLEAYAKAEGALEASQFQLEPKPQAGDKPGFTSLFVGALPKELVGQHVEVTIPNVVIGDGRFRIAFSSNPPKSGDHGMPDKVEDEAEKKLYLTAGGLYTEADIRANGQQTASQKFKGIKAQHDHKPKAGDKLCPISMTKANPKFTWIIGGKQYEFCCPPCVDEFLQTAKDNPAEIKDPAEYIKK